MAKIDRIIEKIFSGRFLVTMIMVCTYCFIAVYMVTSLSDKISGDFVLGYLGGVSTSFMLLMQWYFDKEERQVKGESEYEKTTTYIKTDKNEDTKPVEVVTTTNVRSSTGEEAKPIDVPKPEIKPIEP